MSDFRNLSVWQKAHALALHTDRVASGIRVARHSSLKSQMTRAAMSIAANIAEGRRQESEREFARFLRYSIGSSSELEHHLIVANDLGVIDQREGGVLLAELTEVRKMLYGLLRTVQPSTAKPVGAGES